MGFYVWTCIGIAIGILHVVLPGAHRVGAASAIALGVGGAWGGALFAAAFVQGGWAMFPPIAIAGAIVGAVGAVASLEWVTERFIAAEERRESTGVDDPDRRARVNP